MVLLAIERRLGLRYWRRKKAKSGQVQDNIDTQKTQITPSQFSLSKRNIQNQQISYLYLPPFTNEHEAPSSNLTAARASRCKPDTDGPANSHSHRPNSSPTSGLVLTRRNIYNSERLASGYVSSSSAMSTPQPINLERPYEVWDRMFPALESGLRWKEGDESGAQTHRLADSRVRTDSCWGPRWEMGVLAFVRPYLEGDGQNQNQNQNQHQHQIPDRWGVHHKGPKILHSRDPSVRDRMICYTSACYIRYKYLLWKRCGRAVMVFHRFASLDDHI